MWEVLAPNRKGFAGFDAYHPVPLTFRKLMDEDELEIRGEVAYLFCGDKGHLLATGFGVSQ